MYNLITLLLFFYFISQKQYCDLKDQLIIEVIKDRSIQVFFENKKTIYVYDSLGCLNHKKRLKINKHNVEMLEHPKREVLEIINFKRNEDCVYIELKLFNKNTLYNAEFNLINNHQVKLENSWITHIKQP